MAGFYDFGPLGVELKTNLKRIWWKNMVQSRDNMYGLDSSIIASPKIWEASGHISGFSDPMVDCKESKLRYRADQVFWAAVRNFADEILFYITVVESDDTLRDATLLAEKLIASRGLKQKLQPLQLTDLTNAPQDIYHLLPSPATGNIGTLTYPRDFNLMFQTSVGALSDNSSVAYLRPETAQGIFTNFIALQRATRAKIPFGIAQIGKAFRNELTPKNFIFRSREFEQMEIEYFISPEDCWESVHREWIQRHWDWLRLIGLREDLMSLQKHSNDKLAHYAKACTDILFRFPFGQQELMGVAARGNFDLSQHSKYSGKTLEYQDPSGKGKFIPHVIEPSVGVDRLFLALMVSAYREEIVNDEKRIVLGFHPAIAPIKVAVFPLVTNNQEISNLAKEITRTLRKSVTTEFDSAGGIGKRYRRADEAGIPFCITVDFDSLQASTVTVRHRDTMEQQRVHISELQEFLEKLTKDPILD
eukprot:gene1594-1688_t